MDLTYTPEQQAFRAEVRAWMESHVPKEPLVTLECREGYDQHVEWERTLASGNWGMVTWPEQFGGRGLDLIEWLIFEEEYFRAGGPNRANQNGIFLLGPDGGRMQPFRDWDGPTAPTSPPHPCSGRSQPMCAANGALSQRLQGAWTVWARSPAANARQADKICSIQPIILKAVMPRTRSTVGFTCSMQARYRRSTLRLSRNFRGSISKRTTAVWSVSQGTGAGGGDAGGRPFGKNSRHRQEDRRAPAPRIA